MDIYVVSLIETQMGDTHLVGVKAAVLGELKRVGFPVPDGVSITTHAFKLALRPYLDQIDSILKTHDLGDLDGAQAASKTIHTILADLVIPAPVVMSLKQKLLEIVDPGTPLAVRSSGTAEDTPDASFAGLYDSKIGVSGDDAIHCAILDVWRSYFNPTALNYRSTTSDKGHKSSMGVLILPVVEAETSGVAFSMDPVGYRKNRIVVTASWGLGMGVVDGTVGTDTAWATREGAAERFEVESYQVSEKTNQYTLNKQGALVKKAVPATRQRMACLPDPWLLRVAQFCVAAEVYFGCPQDMEWAIAGGQVWVLQSRPITALPPDLRRPSYFNVDWKILGEPRLAWTQYPYWRYALKPLEMDYAYDRRDASRESCYFTGSETFWNVKIIHGYAYATWAPSDLPAGHRRIRREMVADLGDRLHRQGKTAWDYWGPEIERATERLDRFDFESATDSQIADHLENARGVYHRHWTIHGSRLWITNRPHQSALMALLDHQNLDIDEIADELFEGEPTPSTRLIQGLYRLAQSASESPAIVALIIDPPEDVLEVMGDHPEAGSFLSLYHEFIREFGVYSGVGYGADGTITTPTWREQPALVLGFVSRYLNPGVPDPATTRLAAQEKRDLQLKEMVERCGDPISVAELKREIDFGRRQAAIMEIHNHYIDQMMNGQLRHAILGAAGRLVKRSILAKSEEIFWLHFDEITLALRSEKDISFQEEISRRKKQHLEWKHLDPPPLLGVPGAYLPIKPPSRRMFKECKGKADSSIRGIGASSGRYRGRARIVSSLELLPDIQPGEILVAKTAGPRWTPILPTLGGLVLDGGSVGQHHSIIAREFGIPAVVGTGNGTSRISDGAWITIDGDTGAIEMEA